MSRRTTSANAAAHFPTTTRNSQRRVRHHQPNNTHSTLRSWRGMMLDPPAMMIPTSSSRAQELLADLRGKREALLHRAYAKALKSQNEVTTTSRSSPNSPSSSKSAPSEKKDRSKHERRRTTTDIRNEMKKQRTKLSARFQKAMDQVPRSPVSLSSSLSSSRRLRRPSATSSAPASPTAFRRLSKPSRRPSLRKQMSDPAAVATPTTFPSSTASSEVSSWMSSSTDLASWDSHGFATMASNIGQDASNFLVPNKDNVPTPPLVVPSTKNKQNDGEKALEAIVHEPDFTEHSLEFFVDSPANTSENETQKAMNEALEAVSNVVVPAALEALRKGTFHAWNSSEPIRLTVPDIEIASSSSSISTRLEDPSSSDAATGGISVELGRMTLENHSLKTATAKDDLGGSSSSSWAFDIQKVVDDENAQAAAAAEEEENLRKLRKLILLGEDGHERRGLYRDQSWALIRDDPLAVTPPKPKSVLRMNEDARSHPDDQARPKAKRKTSARDLYRETLEEVIDTIDPTLADRFAQLHRNEESSHRRQKSVSSSSSMASSSIVDAKAADRFAQFHLRQQSKRSLNGSSSSSVASSSVVSTEEFWRNKAVIQSALGNVTELTGNEGKYDTSPRIPRKVGGGSSNSISGKRFQPIGPKLHDSYDTLSTMSGAISIGSAPVVSQTPSMYSPMAVQKKCRKGSRSVKSSSSSSIASFYVLPLDPSGKVDTSQSATKKMKGTKKKKKDKTKGKKKKDKKEIFMDPSIPKLGNVISSELQDAHEATPIAPVISSKETAVAPVEQFENEITEAPSGAFPDTLFVDISTPSVSVELPQLQSEYAQAENDAMFFRTDATMLSRVSEERSSMLSISKAEERSLSNSLETHSLLNAALRPPQPPPSEADEDVVKSSLSRNGSNKSDSKSGSGGGATAVVVEEKPKMSSNESMKPPLPVHLEIPASRWQQWERQDGFEPSPNPPPHIPSMIPAIIPRDISKNRQPPLLTIFARTPAGKNPTPYATWNYDDAHDEEAAAPSNAGAANLPESVAGWSFPEPSDLSSWSSFEDGTAVDTQAGESVAKVEPALTNRPDMGEEKNKNRPKKPSRSFTDDCQTVEPRLLKPILVNKDRAASAPIPTLQAESRKPDPVHHSTSWPPRVTQGKDRFAGGMYHISVMTTGTAPEV